MKFVLLILSFIIIFANEATLQGSNNQLQNPNQPSQRTPNRQQPTRTNSERPRQKRPPTVCDTVCYCNRDQANCRQKQIRKIPFGPWPNGLTSIYFDQNLILSIPRATFGHPQLQRIEMLSLSYNELTEIQSNTFEGLVTLRELVLSHNRIENIESGAFNGLNALENINLDNNKLKTLDDAPFSRNTYLRQISIEKNFLEIIQSNFFENLKALSSMGLSQNKWMCNCDLMGMYLWLKSGKQLQGDPPLCSNPHEKRGLSIQSFTFQEFQELCKNEWAESLNKTDTVMPHEILFTSHINETCSNNYTSTQPVHICYISPDISTVPGTTICLDCIGMRNNELLNDTQVMAVAIFGANYQIIADNGHKRVSETSLFEVNITWTFPKTFVNLSFDNRLIYHNNGTLCIDLIQVNDGGHYTCTAEANNVTSRKVINVNVANIPIKVAIGLIVCLLLTILIVAIIFLRWWNFEVKAL